MLVMFSTMLLWVRSPSDHQKGSSPTAAWLNSTGCRVGDYLILVTVINSPCSYIVPQATNFYLKCEVLSSLTMPTMWKLGLVIFSG